MERSPHDSPSDELFTEVYEELRRLARRELNSRPPAASLNTTALVHEAWLKIHRGEPNGEMNRPRFLSLAAIAMRHVFFNYVRDKKTEKRGRDWQRVTLNDVWQEDQESGISVELLADSLTELRSLNERHGSLAEMRLLAGMTVAECAEVLGVSASTVEREWRVARAWIGSRLEQAG